MRNKWVVILASSILVLLIAAAAYAAANGFSIDWRTVDGGGGSSQGGDYAVSGTIGQHDAGEVMSGGDYSVVGGFWGGGLTPPSPNMVYLPLVLR